MEIKVDNEVLFTLSETQIKILCDDINADIVNEDIKRRLEWVITHKIDECLSTLKQEWIEGGKLVANGVTMLPLDNMALAELIFAQPDYKCRKTKDAEFLENGN